MALKRPCPLLATCTSLLTSSEPSTKLLGLCSHRLPHNLTTAQQHRTLFDSILSSALGTCPNRHLSHSKFLPYKASSIFQAVSDVSGYPTFVPFTIASTVMSRDAKGYPVRAKLRIGYTKFGLEEDWDSNVSCDPDQGTIMAESSQAGSDGLFEVLRTRWKICDADSSGDPETLEQHRSGYANKTSPVNSSRVDLDIDVKFRNPIYDQMFAQVESRVANAMISAFEGKIKDIERNGRQ